MAYTSPSPAEASVSTQPTLAQPLSVHIYRPCGCPTGSSCLDRRLDKGKVEPRIFASQSPELLTPKQVEMCLQSKGSTWLVVGLESTYGKAAPVWNTWAEVKGEAQSLSENSFLQ